MHGCNVARAVMIYEYAYPYLREDPLSISRFCNVGTNRCRIEVENATVYGDMWA